MATMAFFALFFDFLQEILLNNIKTVGYAFKKIKVKPDQRLNGITFAMP